MEAPYPLDHAGSQQPTQPTVVRTFELRMTAKSHRLTSSQATSAVNADARHSDSMQHARFVRSFASRAGLVPCDWRGAHARPMANAHARAKTRRARAGRHWRKGRGWNEVDTWIVFLRMWTHWGLNPGPPAC